MIAYDHIGQQTDSQLCLNQIQLDIIVSPVRMYSEDNMV